MKSFRNNLDFCVLAGLMGLPLLAEYLSHLPLNRPNLVEFRNDLVGILLSKSEQLKLVVGATLWLALLFFVQWRPSAPAPHFFKRFDSARPWMALLVIGALFTYAIHWRESPSDFDRHFFTLGVDQSSNILVLLAGLVFGQIHGIAAAGRPAQFCLLGRKILVFFVLFFSVSSLMGFRLPLIYEYQGQTRWTGLWLNPNIYGILMGTGTVLASGLAAWKLGGGQWIGKSGERAVGRGGLGKLMTGFFCLSAVELLGLGLFHSYSRGAWIGTFCGLAFLAWHGRAKWRKTGDAGREGNLADGDRTGSRESGFRWISAAVIMGSVSVLVFWHFQKVDWHPARRIFSVAKTEDFSWRNRIAGWDGAMQIAAEQPWFGAGWYQIVPVYENYYLPPKLVEGGAIETNDFLLLGATLGLPAFFCFGMCVWLSLIEKPLARSQNPELKEADWLQVTCRAGAIVLLAGFWFDGGLFKLATGVTFWVFLELGAGRPAKWGEDGSPPKGYRKKARKFEFGENQDISNVPGLFARSMVWFLPVLAMMLFLGGMFWAKRHDPFVRSWFSLQTTSGQVRCVAVLPKPVRRGPVVVYVHGEEGNLMKDGQYLRQMAEMGLAVVSVDYDQANPAIFQEEFKAVLEYLSRQSWADMNRVAWVGMSLGANRILDYALQYPEQQPRVLVQWSGGTAEVKPSHLNSRLLLVHGGADQIYPLAEVRQWACKMQTNCTSIDFKILADSPHNLEPERELISRETGEYCLENLNGGGAWQDYHSIAQWQANAPPLWWYWMPAGLWLVVGGLAWCWRQQQIVTSRKLEFNKMLLGCGAIAIAICAACVTAIHLVPPQFAISDRTLAAARKYLLQSKEDVDFEALAGQPIWEGRKLKVLLEHTELAGYNRELINWKLDDGVYRDFVLKPVITGQPGERLDWRRLLWEEFYPRVRHEKDAVEATAIVVRHLRERVTVADAPGLPREVPEIWLRQITDRTGFEVVYVAALRSVGVPARLNGEGKAEFYDGVKWREAPATVEL